MHLPKRFYRLPLRFDVERLREEAAALPASAWAPHPNAVPGNSSVRLISVDGGENDRVDGVMMPTPHLGRMPYVRQTLASFGVPWSRSRLLRLAPGIGVPQHADINYHWFTRVRLHIPVVTRPEVRFHCDGESVHMAAGEAWVFDNWRQHHVVNPTDQDRIHLVADTSGNAAFWQLVAASDEPRQRVRDLPFVPGQEPRLLTEQATLRPVMVPAEVELLVGNMRGELVAKAEGSEVSARLVRYHGLLDAFVRDWRQYYALYGEGPDGWADFAKLRDALRTTSRSLAEGLVMRTNSVAAHQVLEGRVLRTCLAEEAFFVGEPTSLGPIPAAWVGRNVTRACLARPIFIVAAPRSGSTLLFETLAASEQLATLGGEAHWLVENIAELCPGAPGVDSNRLTAEQATPTIARGIEEQVLARLVDCSGAPVEEDRVLRLLEKTPKNALRIPFFRRVFPDAQFVFLWREPRGNLASIIEAWRAGRWRTYPRLEGFVLPWSLLLPPGWGALRGRPLEELAAFQWLATNRIIMDDLAGLPPEQWTIVEYDELLATPAATVRRLCAFAGLNVDQGLAQRLAAPLPVARHTLSSPDPAKWSHNEAEVRRVLSTVEPLHGQLVALTRAGAADDGQSPKR